MKELTKVEKMRDLYFKWLDVSQAKTNGSPNYKRFLDIFRNAMKAYKVTKKEWDAFYPKFNEAYWAMDSWGSAAVKADNSHRMREYENDKYGDFFRAVQNCLR